MPPLRLLLVPRRSPVRQSSESPDRALDRRLRLWRPAAVRIARTRYRGRNHGRQLRRQGPVDPADPRDPRSRVGERIVTAGLRTAVTGATPSGTAVAEQ